MVTLRLETDPITEEDRLVPIYNEGKCASGWRQAMMMIVFFFGTCLAAYLVINGIFWYIGIEKARKEGPKIIKEYIYIGSDNTDLLSTSSAEIVTNISVEGSSATNRSVLVSQTQNLSSVETSLAASGTISELPRGPKIHLPVENNGPGDPKHSFDDDHSPAIDG